MDPNCSVTNILQIISFYVISFYHRKKVSEPSI